ncbi:MAG: hypothetical protein AAFR60_03965 [Pseudomonadota bacterium]
MPATLSQNIFPKPRIAVIGDMNLPQCRKYRMYQKLEVLEAAGIAASHSHWEDSSRGTNLLQTATVALFYRERQGDIFEHYLRECRRLGVPVLYDLDDPIFSREIYEANVNLNFLDPIERDSLLGSSPYYLMAMRAADGLIGSTPRICDEMAKLTGKPVSLWRNLVDAEARHAASLVNAVPPQRTDMGRIRIAYASGSRAHEADFRVVEAQLLRHLRDNTHVDLHVIGYLNLPSAFKPYADRITSEPFTDYTGYLTAIAACDYGIIPLVDDVFNDCKSAIRYLDAAMVRLPVIASAVGDFKHVCVHDQTALLASNALEWSNALDRMTSDAALRRRLSTAAGVDVFANQTTTGYLDRMPASLQRALRGPGQSLDLSYAA